MTLFVVWTDAALDEQWQGPWSSVRVVRDGVAFVDSEDTLSRVYHELKWALPGGAALLVAPMTDAKFRGLRPGALSWLRSRRP